MEFLKFSFLVFGVKQSLSPACKNVFVLLFYMMYLLINHSNNLPKANMRLDTESSSAFKLPFHHFLPWIWCSFCPLLSAPIWRHKKMTVFSKGFNSWEEKEVFLWLKVMEARASAYSPNDHTFFQIFLHGNHDPFF